MADKENKYEKRNAFNGIESRIDKLNDNVNKLRQQISHVTSSDKVTSQHVADLNKSTDKQFKHLDERFQHLDESNQKQFDQLNKYNESRFDNMNTKFSNIDTKLDNLTKSNDSRKSTAHWSAGIIIAMLIGFLGIVVNEHKMLVI